MRLAYDIMRARLAALGSSSSAGVPFGAIVSYRVAFDVLGKRNANVQVWPTYWRHEMCVTSP